MKFVCDNCQAKYQIGDEKVAGKTVRMKCRRCGYEIRVRAEGAEAGAVETSAHDHELEAPASLIPAPPVSAPIALSGPPPPRPPAGMIAPRAPVPPRPPSGQMPAVGALAAAHHPPPPPPPQHLPPPPAPRPVTAAAPRPVTAAAPRPVSAAPRPPAAPAPTRRSSSSMPAVQPVAPVIHDDATNQLHAAKPAAAEGPDHEWYVGIRGTPTGPIRRAEIRQRAEAGDIDGDSLVWREGFAEWKPLKNYPELLGIVEAAKAPPPAPVAVLTPPPMPSAPLVPPPAPSVPFALTQPKAPTPAPAPAAPPPAPAPVAPAPVAAAPAPVAAAPAPAPPPAAVAAPAAPAPVAAPVAVLADPFAAPAPAVNGKANGIHVAAVEAPAAAPEPAAAPAPKPAPKEVEPEVDSVRARRRQTHPMAYAFIAAAAVFGGVAAWALLSRPATQIVVVQAPAPTVPATASASASAEPDKATVEVGEIATGSPQGPAAKGPLGPRPKASASATAVAASTAAAAPIDTSGFVNNVPGPAATPPPGPPAGGQLSAGEISGVVAQNQPLVKRKCWQPALEGRATNGPTTARVNGSLVIGASGAVESASASGAEKDFPGLSSCIAARMKNWKFPPSGGSTPVNVPFVFAGQ